VKYRVRNIINERTGHMMELKNSCIVLDGFTVAVSTPNRCSAPKMPTVWREIWLERASDKAAE